MAKEFKRREILKPQPELVDTTQQPIDILQSAENVSQDIKNTTDALDIYANTKKVFEQPVNKILTAIEEFTDRPISALLDIPVGVVETLFAPISAVETYVQDTENAGLVVPPMIKDQLPLFKASFILPMLGSEIAGQINTLQQKGLDAIGVTNEKIAETLGVSKESVDQTMQSINDYYRTAGAFALPLAVKGVGAELSKGGKLNAGSIRENARQIQERGIIAQESEVQSRANIQRQTSEKPGNAKETQIELPDIELGIDEYVKQRFNKPETQKIAEKKVIQTQQREYKELGKTVDEFLENPKYDNATKKIVTDLVEKIPYDKKIDPTRTGFFQKKIFEKVGLLTKQYGRNGGELGARFHDGNVQQAYYLNSAFENYVNPLRKIESEIGSFQFKDASKKVISALENRSNATEILKNDPIANEMYGYANGFYDFFRGELQKKGYNVIDDYFTHVLDVKAADQILSGLMENDAVKVTNLNQFITANSPFLKERLKAEIPLKTDLNNVMSQYLYSVSKQLAYKDGVEYYYNDFRKGVNADPTLSRNMNVAHDFVKSNLRPEYATGKTMRYIMRARNNLYKTFLWNNIKAAAVNSTQRQLADVFISKEAKAISTDLFKNRLNPSGNILDALNEAKRENPIYSELNQLDARRSQQSKVSRTLEKYDVFRKSEAGNWNYSELAGITNSVIRDTGAKTLAQINEALNDPKVFSKAVREARDLAARTQMSPDVAYRPFGFDKPLARIAGMFWRFPLGQYELFAKSFLGKLEGAEGLRAQTILRRGLMEDTKPVDFLRSTEYLRQNLEISLKEAKKQKFNLGGSEKVIKEYIGYLKGKETELNGIIKNLEPLSGNKPTVVRKWLKYMGTGFGISLSYRMIQSALIESIGADENRKKRSFFDHAVNSMMDVSPLPMYRLNPKEIFSPTIVPDIEFAVYGNPNLRGATKSLVDYGINVTPLGRVNMLTQRITGQSAGDVAKESVSKSKSKTGRTFKRRELK